jgi:asparagine synthase (glutamine-hydrolysing)
MCGIWFSLGFDPDPGHIDVVGHRGPDGSGWRVFESRAGWVALGHRRLSIIDLSDAARQPMEYAEERYWIVYNGEIYNHLELRDELSALGHRFRTRSDTEVLLAALVEWGEAALERCIGMFAFVLWDRVTHSLIATRDRFAIKPLYFFATSRGIAFASEIKQFIGLEGFSARLNVPRAYDFLLAGIMEHTDETLFDGVRQLRGGECLRLDLSQWRPGDAVQVRRWYSILEPATLELSEEEASRRFRELLTDSVKIHLRSMYR